MGEAQVQALSYKTWQSLWLACRVCCTQQTNVLSLDVWVYPISASIQIEIRNEIINNLNKELSTKSRVTGDCQARFCEKGGWKSLHLLDNKEWKLQDIEIRYGIKVVDDNTLFHLEAKKMDSALILLPVFRDKMAFNSTRSRWQISIETEKMNKK